MPVYFNTIGNPDQKYDAVLTAIEPAPEKISTTSSTDSAIYYVGYIEVPNPDKRFRIDMTAQVFIVIDQAKDVLLVPSAAIQSGAMSSASSQATANKSSDQQTTNNKTIDNTENNNTADSTAVNGQNRYVRVLKADGSVEERAVKVGIDNRVNAQILSGLQAGEAVIIGEESAGGEGRRGGPSEA